MAQGTITPLRVTTPTDLEIVMTRSFRAPKALVFDAFTKPEHITRWLGRRDDEMPVCEVDLRPGGAFRYGWRFADGGEMGMHGQFREVSPPDRLVHTEVFEGEYNEVMGGETLVTTFFEEDEGITTVTLTIRAPSKAARDSILATGAAEGVEMGYSRLDELLPSIA
jgi:uncharacterized protein YndB with AHSA1/START domain